MLLISGGAVISMGSFGGHVGPINATFTLPEVYVCFIQVWLNNISLLPHIKDARVPRNVFDLSSRSRLDGRAPLLLLERREVLGAAHFTRNENPPEGW